MDAIKFLKERNRMCKTNVSCYNCPAGTALSAVKSSG